MQTRIDIGWMDWKQAQFFSQEQRKPVNLLISTKIFELALIQIFRTFSNIGLGWMNWKIGNFFKKIDKPTNLWIRIMIFELKLIWIFRTFSNADTDWLESNKMKSSQFLQPSTNQQICESALWDSSLTNLNIQNIL
jgi:hypothetical protein